MIAKTKRKSSRVRPIARPTSRSRAVRAEAGNSPDLVVGIGASAGGLQALKAFFGAMPPHTGFAFVVVVHLDPTHESLMAELIGHVTGLTASQARDRDALAANHVYIIPPNRTLTLEGGTIRLHEVANRRALRGVIDNFFRSLAQAHGERAAAIVLSGSGTEGTLGARAVKEAGGLVMAQTPETATQTGMPDSVIGSGIVDAVIEPQKMSGVLLRYVRRSEAKAALAVSDNARSMATLTQTLALLRERTRYDFRGYKKGTLQRRIARRMGLQQIGSAGKYLEFLRANPAEIDRLFKDMFIGVTSFFRDPPAFDELAEKVLARLVRNRDADTPIRIWIPGCSTGEEAYSIAIVLAEQITAARSSARMQIFATDVDEDALEIARGGSYPQSIALDVTPQRLRRFFTLEDHRYTVVKSIRECVVFATQNLLGDPPFSRLDMVSCRNVLIYFEPETQQKLLTLFHFALNPGGCLFLGNAEGVGSLGEHFVPVVGTRRIFRRSGSIARPALDLSSLAASATETAASSPSGPTMSMLADRRLLEHFTPTAVVVRSSGHILRFYGAMERFIRLPTGEATFNILTLARDPLKPALRAALHEAVRRNRRTMFETIDISRGRERSTVRITVRPVDEARSADGLWLIVFEEISTPVAAGARKAAGSRPPDLVRRLELELRATRKEQQHLIEQLERSNEELKVANEEVLSINEELQSTNEELTTSKEELQSMNEELTTLNGQLHDKVHELTTVNDDLANLLASADIAAVFLDTHLCIKRFTAAASQVLNLRPGDAGRPISHLTSNLIDANITRDARSVLRTLVPIQKDVSAQDGKHYLLRCLPYRTANDQVEGVVLTLVDITALKQTERELEQARAGSAEDLRRMTRLHELAGRLAGPGETHVLLEEILHAAIEITGAPMGDIQAVDESGALIIIAQSGFERPFLNYFARVDAGTRSSCGHASVSRERVIAEDVNTSTEFAGASARAMLDAGAVAVQSTPVFDRTGSFMGMLSTHYRQPHRFEAHELRWLDLLALHVSEVLERKRTHTQLAQSQAELEQRVADRTQWLILMHEVSRAINEAPTWDDALRRVLQRICEMEHWQICYVYLPDPKFPESLALAITSAIDDRFRHFHALAQQQRYDKGQSLPGRVYTRAEPIWLNDPQALASAMPIRGVAALKAGLHAAAVLPVTLNDQVIAVLELLSDQPHPPNEQLSVLMRDVSDQIARVLERERVTAHMADLLWREQQDLLHTLHDALGQTLTGLGMLSGGLSERLAGTDVSNAESAREIARQAKNALEQVRQLTKSLFPVEVEAESLTAALRDLAAATQSLHHIQVRVDGQGPKHLRDGSVATQLYRIAQEAITNAVKHARAHAITIRLDGDAALLRLQVSDDGVGIRPAQKHDGMGLKIMRYRASSIGGVLSVEPGAASGTVVSCVLPTDSGAHA